MNCKLLGVFAVLLATATAACGDDDGSANTADATTTVDASITPDASLTTLTGIIRTDNDTPLANATVRVFGSTTSATTGSDGRFSLTVPEGVQLIEFQAAGHWGRIQPFDTTSGEFDFGMLSDTEIGDVATALSYTTDVAKGAIAVEFHASNDGDGESASLSATSELTFTFHDATGPTVSDSLVAGGNPVLIFLGVPVGTTSVTVSGSPGNTICAAPEGFDGAGTPPMYPVVAKTLTVVETTCADL